MQKEKKNRLFGTDGIRSKFGKFPLSDDSIRKIARTSQTLFNAKKILIGMDTRASGIKIRDLFLEGLPENVRLFDTGVITTPGISYLTEKCDFDLGVMISASHNPSEYNGLKFFTSKGEKISKKNEEDFENIYYETEIPERGRGIITAYSGIERYTGFLKNFSTQLSSQKHNIVVDCANGSTSGFASEVFNETGNSVIFINDNPDGQNINLNCGSTFPNNAGNKVSETGSDLGISYDGDGDRVLILDRDGREINGDHIIYILSRYFKRTKKNFPFKIVGTIMTNISLEKKLNEIGFELIRSDVGDRNVFDMMKKTGSLIGGEPSGHIILGDYCKSGDGILTSLIFLKAIEYLSITPDEIYSAYKPFPQKTISIPVKEKKDIKTWDTLQKKIKIFNEKYGNNSRLVIRYSGTEPKIRIMVESEYSEIVEKNIDDLKKYISSEIGGEI